MCSVRFRSRNVGVLAPRDREADVRARDHDHPGHHPAGRALSGGQRQRVAVARAAAFGSSGIPVILISHNMPHVFEVADRIHIHRLGKRIAVVTPKTHTMNEVVAIMTGAAAAALKTLKDD